MNVDDGGVPKIELRPFDAVEHLKTKEDMVCYLEAALEDGTPDMIAAALRAIARACGLGSEVPVTTPGPD